MSSPTRLLFRISTSEISGGHFEECTSMLKRKSKGRHREKRLLLLEGNGESEKRESRSGDKMVGHSGKRAGKASLTTGLSLLNTDCPSHHLTPVVVRSTSPADGVLNTDVDEGISCKAIAALSSC